MKLKNKLIFLSIFIISLNSCANIKIISHNKEDIFIFKAETRLIDLKKNIVDEKFISYENSERKARDKSLNRCKNFLKKLKKKEKKCILFNYGFTEYGDKIKDI